MTKSRFEFIDLAKGICIILITIGHCGVKYPDILFLVTMPLFFVVSGLFYKSTDSFYSFIINKLNKIIIPFAFFYLLGYLAFYGIKIMAPSLLITKAEGIFDIYSNKQFFNGPIWFLLALFWCNIYFYIIESVLPKKETNYFFTSAFIVTIIGLGGWYIGNICFHLPFFLDVGMTSLPFFYLGTLLKNTTILKQDKHYSYNLLFILISLLICILVPILLPYRISLHYNIIEGYSTYILAISSVTALLLICKIIKHGSIISYFGKYSLIVLGLHHLYYRPIKVLLSMSNSDVINNNYTLAIITLALSLASIPICIRFIPWFVAQKDLIKWNQEKKYSFHHMPANQD